MDYPVLKFSKVNTCSLFVKPFCYFVIDYWLVSSAIDKIISVRCLGAITHLGISFDLIFEKQSQRNLALQRRPLDILDKKNFQKKMAVEPSGKPKLDYQYETVVHNMKIDDFLGKGNERIESPHFEGPKGTRWQIRVGVVSVLRAIECSGGGSIWYNLKSPKSPNLNTQPSGVLFGKTRYTRE